ncbi:S41 family peptidase [Clostridium isatidis]|uniref:Peptidase S41 n=1 Tax=Clostridium isatidis TaxID=182773 RepID=A0A343JFF1_9CLOT|nr:S41 family peptidase [Clostridium isatidis]ASW44259.1 peptidase S41 [Clostridium isatidis]NLZ34950.1 S41 family peptidase [Clostridiales bacterium]
MEDKNNQVQKRSLKKPIIITLIIVIFLISNIFLFYLGNILAMNGVTIGKVSEDVASDLSDIKDVQKYELLFQVRNALLAKYDGEIDDEKLLEAAIKGMTDSLNDPYTVFMNAEEYKQFIEQSEGEFVGIGAHLGIKEDKVTVIAPIEGSPAEAAGLQSGDVIIEVDGKELVNPTLDNTVAMIRGEQGTNVTLKVQRNETEILDIVIKRDVIKVEAVRGEIVEDNIGYIQITSFDEDVADEFKNKILELKDKGMKGIILDLRGNPGGFLNEAVEVASQFIEKGKIITYTIDKYDNKVESKSVGGDAIGMPLVVLIDGGSASASEVVTGALRDYGVATTVGEKSFGKGIVQQLIEFEGGTVGLKVTTSKYYSPKGENIHKIGITPDIEVSIPKETMQMEYNRSIDTQYLKALEVLKDKMK